ncbi:MAG TPA: VOC family protein [Mycobacteriales bacterium]|nr:VOC family protein [Mycobacteriales bacterium]
MTSSLRGIPCWMDMMTSDEAKTREFYSELFGWTAAEGAPEFGGYFMFLRHDVPVAGAAPLQPGMEADETWKVYLAVEDARKTLAVATASGGAEVTPAMDIADLGTMAIISDAAGAKVGMWQAGTFAGITVRGEVGAQAWFELHTLAYDENVAFYRDVFGWDAHSMSDTEEFRYTTLGEGDGAVAGINDSAIHAGPDFRSEWGVYIAVDDTDATLAKAVALGGSQVQPPRDSPYGRLAEIADATGCRIKLMGPNTES